MDEQDKSPLPKNVGVASMGNRHEAINFHDGVDKEDTMMEVTLNKATMIHETSVQQTSV